ncbi:hypothetical protein MTO96_030510 [Rhipicephalus appendiculatus]
MTSLVPTIKRRAPGVRMSLGVPETPTPVLPLTKQVNQAVWEPPLTIERLRKCNIELPSVWWCLLGTRDPNRVVFATTEVKKTGAGRFARGDASETGQLLQER